MSASSLYKRNSQEQLLVMQSAITADPANKERAGSVFLYTKNARKRLAEISQAITWHLEDKRTAAGNPVPTNGYSGRQTNRRR